MKQFLLNSAIATCGVALVAAVGMALATMKKGAEESGAGFGCEASFRIVKELEPYIKHKWYELQEYSWMLKAYNKEMAYLDSDACNPPALRRGADDKA